jgi:exosortase/archaeosortase family protein
VKRVELILDFLIKFNLLAIPMYIALFAGINHYPSQMFLTDIVHGVFKSAGYWIERSGIIIVLFAPTDPPGPPLAEIVTMGFDCTAWKTMYAFAALVVASPVSGRRKKMRFILIGGVALFALNIVRLITTLWVGYAFGFGSLDIVHTVLWREGLIIALLALWFLWLRNQKNNISKSQTIFRALYNKITVKKANKRKRVGNKKRKR